MLCERVKTKDNKQREYFVVLQGSGGRGTRERDQRQLMCAGGGSNGNSPKERLSRVYLL